jgi:uncharacterized membrane protein YdbT with pleckstrin-like domain
VRKPADERVCLRARRHGIVLARPLAQAVVLGAAGAVLAPRAWPLALAGAVLAAAGAALALRAVWRWERTQIVVTTTRICVAQGTLRRRSASVPLAHATAIEIEQSLLGRLLGYGTLVAGGLEVDHVPEPRRVSLLVERLAVD